MKKLLFLLAIFCNLHAKAQPYSISFAGTGLSSVKVENLQSGLIVNLNAGDILRLSTPTGIPEVKNLKSSGLKIYPNPMTDKSTLEILPPVAGDAIISICDMTGKVLNQFKSYVENYAQEFSLSGLKNGLYIINVQGNGYQFSEKLLSNGRSNGTVIIARVSNNIQAVSEKKSIKDSKGVQTTIDMAYNAGQRLKYTGISGNNSTIMTDIPIADKTITFNFIACSDGDNINYPVVSIGTQIWMAENLKTTKYNDGTAIPNVTVDATWEALTTGAYSDYNYTPANSTTYGRLYNWYAVDNNATTKVASNGGKNVCPTSWHLPTDAEWTTLTTYLGGESVSGGKLKETVTTHWTTPNTGATNETGFTAVPGGYREWNGSYGLIGNYGIWWSSTISPPANAWMRYVVNTDASVSRNDFNRRAGISVRCLKD
ncbi:MAG: T9SS type A sorting domain-containing protein [Bacteroidia bacterium]|nr:T9SS type A sorting domain-containing protein [Bacteroidia bacterium]